MKCNYSGIQCNSIGLWADRVRQNTQHGDSIQVYELDLSSCLRIDIVPVIMLIVINFCCGRKDAQPELEGVIPR